MNRLIQSLFYTDKFLQDVADARASDEAGVLELADHLPAEAVEALLELATGGTPQNTQPVIANADPFDPPDALRRFQVMSPAIW